MMRRRGPGVVRTMARTAVVAGTASAVSGRVHHRQAERWAAEAAEQQAAAGDAAALQQQLAAQQSQEAQSALSGQPAAADLSAQLAQLAQLRQSGVLSDEEFAAAKAKLLG